MSAAPDRLVVVCPGGHRDPWALPAAEWVDRPWLWGGVRSLHELAFAAAAAGHAVELRGWLDRELFDELAAVAGVPPELPRAERRPAAGEAVVVPEGHEDPTVIAPLWLSGAQLVIMAMGPLGLTGWPFIAGWERPSPLTVPLDALNRDESFGALAAMGVVVWSESPVIAELAAAAGGASACVGLGQPMPFPEGAPEAERTFDAVWLADNRWAAAAEQIAGELAAAGALVGMIERTAHADLLRRLGTARLLIYPGRVEGEPRITREARALGTVPIVLAGNPVATQLDEAHGVLAADTPAGMVSAAHALLADPPRRRRLADAARRTALEEADWDRFVARVGAAIDRLPAADPAQGARDGIGAGLAAAFAAEHAASTAAHERVTELELELGQVREHRDVTERERDELLTAIHAEREALRAARAQLGRRAVRLTLALADRVPSRLRGR